eukprot:jgi/Mesvir1/1730/Mv21182-RA.1
MLAGTTSCGESPAFWQEMYSLFILSGSSACVALLVVAAECLDSEAGAKRDWGCPDYAPICYEYHTPGSPFEVNRGQSVGESDGNFEEGVSCTACLDTEVDAGTDLGCEQAFSFWTSQAFDSEDYVPAPICYTGAASTGSLMEGEGFLPFFSDSVNANTTCAVCLDSHGNDSKDVGCTNDKPFCFDLSLNAFGPFPDMPFEIIAQLAIAQGLTEGGWGNNGDNGFGLFCSECNPQLLSPGNFSTIPMGCTDDKPLCLGTDQSVTSKPMNTKPRCFACIDDNSTIANAQGFVDTACSKERPFCADLFFAIPEKGGLSQRQVDGYGSFCAACVDDTSGSGNDTGCAGATPYCVSGECNEFINPSCSFTRNDVTADHSASCSTEIAVEARLQITLVNCTTTSLNLTALASMMGSVLNVSRCALELEYVSRTATVSSNGRRLLQSPPGSSVITFLLLVFVADDQLGKALLSNFDNNLELALLLALQELNIGEILLTEITSALLRLGTATSDPHFITPRGQKFDFNGAAGHTYCIVSDKELHVNARFMGPAKSSLAVKAVASQTDNRTWIDQVSILHGGDRVLVDAESAPGAPYTSSFGVVLVNGVSSSSPEHWLAFYQRNRSLKTSC